MHHDDPLHRTLTELTDRIQDEVAGRVQALTARVADAERQGRDAGRREGFASAAALAHARRVRLLDACAALDRATSLSAVLETLADSAAHEAPRVAVLIVRGDRLDGWRLVDFGSVADAPFDLAVSEGGVIADAVRTDTASTPRAGLAAPAFAALPEGRHAVAVPLCLAGHVVAVVYADEGAVDEGEVEGDIEWGASLEVIARHAARCLETITALETARFVADQAGWPVRSPSRQGPFTAAESRAEADEEQAARRYARLLVSEIRLYHELAIAEGRRARDLLSRLGGEIARAQALYEQRVPDAVRRSTDFFRAELVRTLADGDAELLGH